MAALPSHNSPGQPRPVTTLSISLAAVLAMVMLYLPFQFHSLPLQYIYPYLRWFGLSYALSGICLSVIAARLLTSRPWETAGRVLLIATLAMHAYLVAYKPQVVTGEFLYAALLSALVLSALYPAWENTLFLVLYVVLPSGIGWFMAFRPAFFPSAVFGNLPATLGPILMVAGLQLGVCLLAARRWRVPVWGSLLLAALPLGWFSLCWAQVGNWLGVSLYGTLSILPLVHAIRLRWPWHVQMPSLRKRVLALAIGMSVLPLSAMGTFAVYATQSLESEANLKTLTVRVLQAERELDKLMAKSPSAVTLAPTRLTAELSRILPDAGSTIEVLAADRVPDSWLEQADAHVGVQEGFGRARERELLAYIWRPELGMALTVGMPAAVAYRLANRVALLALLLTAGIALLSVVAGLMLTNRITEQVDAVRNLALAIGTRHFGRQIPIRCEENDEVSDLLVSVNSMSAALETYGNELQRLLAVTDTALSHLSLDELVNRLLHRICEVLPSETCVILLLEVDGSVLRPVGAAGFADLGIGSQAVATGKGFAGSVAQLGKPVVIDDLSPVGAAYPDLPSSIRSVIGVPLQVEGRTIGVIHVGAASPRHFTHDDLRLLQLVADRIALAIDHAHLYNELRTLNSTLEQRVTERTAELLAANQELEAFSYTVSHDLRAPLRNIDGFSQALAEDYGELLDKEGLNYLSRIRAGTRRMSQLIDALLQLARVNRMPLSRVEMDLSALLRSTAADFSRLEPERCVSVAVQNGMVVTADPKLMRIAVENLLQNAFKFTSQVLEAQITCGMQAGGERPVFFIRDNGAGFDMAYVDKLFSPFQRLHAESQFEGTGIGLATVQRIIHRHGGKVWAEGAVGQGATFYFTL